MSHDARAARGARTRWARVRVRTILMLASGAGVVAAAAAAVYYASQWEPPFYRAAMAVPSSAARQLSEVALHDGTVLSNHLRKPGTWQATFTAEEINGYLAEHSAESVPPRFHDPRVALTPKAIVAGCRANWGALHAVVWLEVEPYLADPGTLAVRIRKVRAGHLPLPLKQVLEAADKAIRETNLQIRWRQADGDPVAMISMPAANDGHGAKIRFSALRLSDGKIVVAGSTGGITALPAASTENAKTPKERGKQPTNSVK